MVTGCGSAGLRNRASGRPGRMEPADLAVWRLEGDKGRYHAWQSCRLPEAGAPAR